MSDQLARYLLAQQGTAGSEGPVFTAYLIAWDALTGANTVTISGSQQLFDLSFLGDPAGITTGRVLLLRTPGSPVILGNIRKPVTG
jgi:hypothetical protein